MMTQRLTNGLALVTPLQAVVPTLPPRCAGVEEQDGLGAAAAARTAASAPLQRLARGESELQLKLPQA